jgi:hypothetical protein
VRTRRLFCQLAVKGMGHSRAGVGRHLGVTPSAVNRLAVSEALSDLKQYFNLGGKQPTGTQTQKRLNRSITVSRGVYGGA